MPRSDIIEGTLTVVGKNHKGDEVTLTADVADVVIDHQVQFEDYYSITPQMFRVSNKWTVTATIRPNEEGKYGAYKIKQDLAEPVERTARVHLRFISEAVVPTCPTLKELREAAEKAGVDENAEFDIHYMVNVEKAGSDQYVEFRWTD